MINTKNARKIIADIDKILGTNEYRNYTLKGVSNLSYSDLEDLKMYAEFAITDQLDLLTPLRGNKAEVWDKYNVEIKNEHQ